MSEFTAEQKAAALDREVRLRQQVYPNRVLTHRMTQRKADYETAIMRAIAADYHALAQKERLL